MAIRLVILAISCFLVADCSLIGRAQKRTESRQHLWDRLLKKSLNPDELNEPITDKGPPLCCPSLIEDECIQPLADGSCPSPMAVKKKRRQELKGIARKDIEGPFVPTPTTTQATVKPEEDCKCKSQDGVCIGDPNAPCPPLLPSPDTRNNEDELRSLLRQLNTLLERVDGKK